MSMTGVFTETLYLRCGESPSGALSLLKDNLKRHIGSVTLTLAGLHTVVFIKKPEMGMSDGIETLKMDFVVALLFWDEAQVGDIVFTTGDPGPLVNLGDKVFNKTPNIGMGFYERIS